MPSLSRHDATSAIDPVALSRFLARSRERLTQMQSLLPDHARDVDARDVRRILQWSREIAVGAEVAGLSRLSDAALDVEELADEGLRSTADPALLAVRMNELLRALGAQLDAASTPVLA